MERYELFTVEVNGMRPYSSSGRLVVSSEKRIAAAAARKLSGKVVPILAEITPGRESGLCFVCDSAGFTFYVTHWLEDGDEGAN